MKSPNRNPRSRGMDVVLLFDAILPVAHERPAMRKLQTMPQRHGFTMIELLTVMAIISLLLGLLLPAVQAAREAGRRMQCGNQLRQLGLAAQQHHDTHRHLPPGVGYYPPGTNGVFGTWFFHLLPYLDQGNLFNDSLGSVPFPSPVGPTAVHYPGNNGVYRQPVPVYLCPSDPSVAVGVLTIDGFSFGASSYAVNAFVSSRDPRTSAPIDIPQGKARIPADFPDGTSNTILHAEKYARCSSPTLPPLLGDGGNAWAYCTAALFPWLPEPMNPPGHAYQTGFAIGALAMRGAPNAIGPGSKFQARPAPYLGNCDPTRTSTPHEGMLVGLADGSVRTLNPSMSGETWWAAVTPKGSEVLGSDF